MLSWSASFGNTPGADSSSRKLPLSNGTGPATESTTRFARQPASHGRQHQSFNDDPHRGWFPQMPMRTLRDSEYRAFGLKTRTASVLQACRHAWQYRQEGEAGKQHGAKPQDRSSREKTQDGITPQIQSLDLIMKKKTPPFPRKLAAHMHQTIGNKTPG